MTNKLIILADNVKDKNIITQSLLPDVSYINLSSRDSVTVFREKIASLDLSNLTNIGIVYDNTSGRAPFVEYTDEELAEEDALQCTTQNILPDIVSSECSLRNLSATRQKCIEKRKNIKPIKEKYVYDTPPVYDTSSLNETPNISTDYVGYTNIITAFHKSTKHFSDGFLTVINEIKSNSNLNTLDIISCNTRDNQQFSELLEKGITVRYSTNITGQGGDWILESHNINVTPIYFTDNITTYPYRLGALTPSETSPGSGIYAIADADNLYWLMTYTTRSGAAPNLSSTFTITADIDMNDVTGGGPSVFPTQSIGKFAGGSEFTGSLYGNDKTVRIRNINFSNPIIFPALAGFMGFFGNFGTNGSSITTGYVENLTIRYTTNIFTFGIFSPLTTLNNFYGLLCGIMRSGTFKNCRVEFDNDDLVAISYVSGTGATGNNNIGGLIGRKQLTSIVEDCSLVTTGDFAIQVSSFGSCVVGGLIGITGFSILPNVDVGIFSTNLSIGGDLSIQAAINGNGTIFIGGFAGVHANYTGDTNIVRVIDNCNINCNNLYINDKHIRPLVSIENAVLCGGFSGTNEGNVDISNCSINTNEFAIEFDQCNTKYIGGYIGLNRTDNNPAQESIVTDCTLNATDLSIIINNTIINNVSRLGGFTAVNENSNAFIDYCIVNITNLDMSIDSSNIEGDIRLGCIIGDNNNGSASFINSTIGNASINIVNSNSFINFGCFIGNNNNSTTDNCNTTIGSITFQNTATSKFLWIGGVFGIISQGTNIFDNTTNINTASFIGRSTNEAFIGGLAGAIYDIAGLQGCVTNIGNTSYIESAAICNNIALGCLLGVNFSSGPILNNTITYGNNLTLKANQDSTTINVNSTVGQGNTLDSSNNIVFVIYPLIFNSVSNGTGIIVNNTPPPYLIQPQLYTINVNNQYNIDLSDITLFFYLYQAPNDIVSEQSCCQANVCNANPVVANYDNRNVVVNMGGQTLVSAVNDFYRAAANNQLRPNAPPIFKTYQQMMDWKQRQNRR